MKFVVDIPRDLVARIRGAVAGGEYSGAQEFLLMAVENQLALENGSGEAGAMVPPSLDEFLVDPDEGQGQEDSKAGEADRPEGGNRFSLSLRAYRNLQTVDIPPIGKRPGDPLWGQFNRILPMKVVMRALANNLEREAGGWVPLDGFRDEVATRARDLGLRLQELDREKGRGRGDKLAPGFPTADGAEKSKERFKGQFVGSLTRDGHLRGAPPELGWVDIVDGNPRRLGITEAGLAFARLENPVIDGDLGSDWALSDSEAEFYIEHVAEHLPEEHAAMAAIADWVSNGDDRPDALSEKVRTLNDEWSQAHANTIRTGLVSRMYELGLLTRERVGQRGVAYRVTPRGREKLLSEVEA